VTISLPYHPRKYNPEWLETLRHDTGIWSPLEIEAFGNDFYPETDGNPLGETDSHAWASRLTIEMLALYFEEKTNIYVAGNNFLYWEKGNPKAVVSPDVYIVKGAGMRFRDTYKVWDEGFLTPDVVFEMTSRHTIANDMEMKRFIYEQVLKVEEYFLFDPKAEYLKSSIEGFRLDNGSYCPIPRIHGRMHSEQLTLDLERIDGNLRFSDPATGEYLPLPSEWARRAKLAETQVMAEGIARQAAEAEIARLRAELDALRKNER
jgi:Uma2 family endonuclease